MTLRRRFSRSNIWFIGSFSELNTLDNPDPATLREIDFSGALLTQNATGAPLFYQRDIYGHISMISNVQILSEEFAVFTFI